MLLNPHTTQVVMDIAAMTYESEKYSDSGEFALLLDLYQKTLTGETVGGDFSRLDEIIYQSLLNTYPGSESAVY